VNGAINLRRIVNNTVISLGAQMVTWTSTLLLTAAYGRFLGDAAFGQLYFALTFVLLIGFPIECGFNQQLTRDLAQDPPKARRYVASAVLIKASCWAILYVALQLLTRLLGYTEQVRTLVSICGVTLLSTSLASTLAAAHIAFERSSIPAVGSVLEKGSAAIVGIALLKRGATVEVMALVLLGGSVASLVWQALWFFLLEGISFRVHRRDVTAIMRASIPFMVYGALGVVYYRVDTVLLSLITGTVAVGWYGAAYRIFDTLIFFPHLLASVIMYPVFARLSEHSIEELRTALEKTLDALLVAGMPMAIGLALTAPAIISALYQRTEFAHAIPVLQALAPGLICLYANCAFAATLVAVKQERRLTTMAAVALLFNVGLNVVAIPLYQHVGAAWVTSLTELLLLCLAIRAIPRALRPYGSIRVGLRALLASAAMASAIWTLGSAVHAASLGVVVPVAACVYAAAAAALGTVPADDLQALYSSVRRKVFGASQSGRHMSERMLETT
jgi:O-antigen/teichoic acid export membrane protein